MSPNAIVWLVGILALIAIIFAVWAILRANEAELSAERALDRSESVGATSTSAVNGVITKTNSLIAALSSLNNNLQASAGGDVSAVVAMPLELGL